MMTILIKIIFLTLVFYTVSSKSSAMGGNSFNPLAPRGGSGGNGFAFSTKATDLFSTNGHNNNNKHQLKTKQRTTTTRNDNPSTGNSLQSTSSMSSVEFIDSLSSLISTITVYYISTHISKHVKRLVDAVIHTLNPENKIAQISPLIQAKLQPNVTLNPYEKEIADSIIFPDTIDMEFTKIGGLEDIKQSLIESVLSDMDAATFNISNKLLKPSKGILLHGPPGTGKTSLVQALCKRINYPMLLLKPSSLLRKYVGETSQLLKAVFSLVEKIGPCVIFVDEMDSMFRERRDGDAEYDRSLKTEFMQLWDTIPPHSIVIGATNRPQDLDAAVQRRFERSFLVGPPDISARKSIFQSILSELPTYDFDFDHAAAITQDYTPSDIVALCKAATQTLLRDFKKNKALKSSKKKSTSLSASLPTTATLGGVQQLHRSLLIKDLEEAMLSVFPTTWVSRAYGDSVRQPFTSTLHNNRQNMPTSINGAVVLDTAWMQPSSFYHTSYTTPQQQQQQLSPAYTEEEEEEEDIDDDE